MQETLLYKKEDIYQSPKEKIIDLLRNNNRGITIATISKLTVLSRHTVSIVLAELKGAKLVKVRNVGVAKLHFWRGIGQ